MNYAEFTEFIPSLLQELLHYHSLRILRKDDIPGEPSYLNTACDLGTMPNFWHNVRMVQIGTLSKIDGVSHVCMLYRDSTGRRIHRNYPSCGARSPSSFDVALLRFEFPAPSEGIHYPFVIVSVFSKFRTFWSEKSANRQDAGDGAVGDLRHGHRRRQRQGR